MEQLNKSTILVESSSVAIHNLAFAEPVHLPFGEIHSRPSAWLRIDGIVNNKPAHGYAEGTALPFKIPMYDDETSNLESNITAILASVEGSEHTLEELEIIIKSLELGGIFATARYTVESALLDMIARSHNTSVASMLIGEHVDAISVPFGKSITESDTATLLAAFEAAKASGASRFKFKISPANFDHVYAGLRYIQVNYADVSLMVDANGMFNPKVTEHLEMLKQLDDLGMLTIEEPVSREGEILGLNAYRELHRHLKFKTPLTIDDSIKSADDAREALEENLAHIINLKPGRVGSFMECIAIAGLAKEHQKEIMVGGMFEATPGRMATLTLAAYCQKLGFTIPGDVSLPSERLADDLVPKNQLTLSADGEIIFQPQSGWGFTL